MVECFKNDHKVNSKCFICNSIIVLLRDDLNTVYMKKRDWCERGGFGGGAGGASDADSCVGSALE